MSEFLSGFKTNVSLEIIQQKYQNMKNLIKIMEIFYEIESK